MALPQRVWRKGRLVPVLPGASAPFAVDEWFHGKQEPIPDPIEFVCSDKYLDRGNIYPRQATLLKITFLRDDLFTQFDLDVIGEWIDSFEDTGKEGIQPDIFERIRICKEQGRPWFRENIFVGGRRGSKGHMGGLFGAYVLWHYLALGDPQGYFGVDRDKKLTAITFGGKKEQAKVNQWRDIQNIILGGPCFSPYISRPQSEALTVFAPHDFARIHQMARRGVYTENDMATFEIIPKESTVMAGRGPTSFMQHYDEMAHVVATGAIRSAEEVYNAATPALDQFGEWAFIYEGSSPWTQTGQFFTNYERALEKNDDGSPAYPEMLMVQFPSWSLYEDWERAHIIPMRPAKMLRIERVEGGDGAESPSTLPAETPQVHVIERMETSEEVPHFRALRGAIQAYDAQMQQLERANRDTFNVERRAWWAAALNAYLDPEKIRLIWQPVDGRELAQQIRGNLSTVYKMHGDPSKSGANFGLAIGHAEVLPTPVMNPQTGDIEMRPYKHVIFDVLHAWIPADFPDGKIDYIALEQELADYGSRFMPFEMTFDQFNSASPIQHIDAILRATKLPKRVVVEERTATFQLNWRRYETFKSAVNMGLVHAPYFELADLEMRFLQDTGNKKPDHPTSGPVQTKDVLDCMAEVVYTLIGTQIDEMREALGGLRLVPAMAGGIEPFGQDYGNEFTQAGRGAGGGQRRLRPNTVARPGTFRRPGFPGQGWRPPGR